MEKKKRKNVLKVYDPAMCCSTGVCGPDVNASLVEFAGALKSAAEKGTQVERYNLAQKPQAFAENEQVKKNLEKKGSGRLPLIFLNDELKISGRYPSAAELSALLGMRGKIKKGGKCCC
jgi:hypothetical protein